MGTFVSTRGAVGVSLLEQSSNLFSGKGNFLLVLGSKN